MTSSLGFVVIIGMSDNHINVPDFMAEFSNQQIWLNTAKHLKATTRANVFSKHVSATQLRMESPGRAQVSVGRFVKLRTSTAIAPAFALDVSDKEASGGPRRIAHASFVGGTPSLSVIPSVIEPHEISPLQATWTKITEATDKFGDRITNDCLREWLHSVVRELGGFAYVAGHGAFFIPAATGKYYDCGSVLSRVRDGVLKLNGKNCLTVVPVSDNPMQRDDIARNAFSYFNREMLTLLSSVETLRQRIDGGEDEFVRVTTLASRMREMELLQIRISEYQQLVGMSTDMLTAEFNASLTWLEEACSDNTTV